MSALRRMISDIVDGFWRGLNALTCGYPYPRHLDNTDPLAVRIRAAVATDRAARQ